MRLIRGVVSQGGASNGLLTNLVSYWKMDESSDGSAAVTRVDSHGSNDLTDLSPYAASAAGIISNGALLVKANSEALGK